MSADRSMGNGENTSANVGALFDIDLIPRLKKEAGQTDNYVKFTAGTEDYLRVLDVAETLEVTFSKACRLLIRAGYLGFARAMRRESGIDE